METKSKKGIVIFIAVLVIIVLSIVLTVFVIMPNMKIKETEEKLSKINGEELQDKIIARLKDSTINIDNSKYKVEFRTLSSGKSKMDDMALAIFELSNSFGDQKGFVSAIITEKNNNLNGVVIPCFRIAVDKDGNFHNIEYIDHGREEISKIVGKIVEEVFSEYGIDIEIYNNSKYNTKFNNYKNINELKMVREETSIESIYKAITGENYNDVVNVIYTRTFGLDIS